MKWADVRKRFPDQWLELIPIQAYEKYGKQYVDEVAVVNVLQLGSLPSEPYTEHPGYISFAYHTEHRQIVFDGGTLPYHLSTLWCVVHKNGMVEDLYDEGYATGMLETGFLWKPFPISATCRLKWCRKSKTLMKRSMVLWNQLSKLSRQASGRAKEVY